jgi:lon-related putative ATP-dependent protease
MAKKPVKTKAAAAPNELAASQVYRICDPGSFSFETTADLPVLHEIIGQERAVSAVDFGIGIQSNGYNIFALGPPGTGKSRTISTFLEREAASMPTPPDWVYVHNFEQAHIPNAIRFPPGRACDFRRDMDKLVEDLQIEINQAFEGEEYEEHKRKITQKVGEQQESRFKELRDKAEAKGYTILRSPSGLAFAPKTADGQPMSRELFNELPDDRQAQINAGLEELNEELQQVMRQVRTEEKAGRESLRDLDKEISRYAAQHLIDDLKAQWGEVEEIPEYLDAVLEDVVENAQDFRKSDDENPMQMMGLALPGRDGAESTFRKYRVNVIVDNSHLEGAPIVKEHNPTFQNLVGRVEHMAQFGALVTDFNMIKAGAIHRANGGFLIMEARELLMKPYAWDALKRALKTCEIRIEDMGQQVGWATTATLDPEPLPYAAKVVLIGEPMLFYLLSAYDPDFSELFKVKADFDVMADRDDANEQLYARFVAHVCETEHLPHFDGPAVARIVEQGSRLIGDQRKLSVRFLDIADLIRESAFWALRGNGGEQGTLVTAADVQKAIEHHTYRSNRLEERLREVITDGTIMVDTAGAIVGQINALSVTGAGDYSFGVPSRITATTRLGDGEVVNIEREVEMSGPIHSKGVLILAGYLGAKYASEGPLSFNARLVFEQSYGGVEGDSASSTELYALLSALSRLPIHQRFAVTGSVNQRGQVQAIGGVNEKIEGFFATCQGKGLQGDEGVLVPATNVPNLMLKQEVRDAIEAGTFHIYPVSTIDEGIAILTGVEAGEADREGVYPTGTVNRLVADRLAELAEKARELAAQGKDKETKTKRSTKNPPAPPEDDEREEE